MFKANKAIILMTILVTTFCLMLYLVCKPKPIYTVDIKAIISRHIEIMKQRNVSEQESNAFTSRFMQILETVMQEYSKHKGVLFVADAVIAGGTDVTSEITQKLQERLGEK